MKRRSGRVHRLRNVLQSLILIAGMASVAGLCAWTLWGPQGVLWAFVGVALAMVVSPSIPPGLILSLYRARPIHEADFPEAYAVLRELAERAGLPAVPRLHHLPSSTLNAFSLGGRRSAAIAVSDGLLRALTRREFVAVVAHEVSHIANSDLWIMALADTISRATGWLSYFGIFLLLLNLPLFITGSALVPWLLVLALVLAPSLMSLLQLGLSRAREYHADLSAAELTGDPLGLAMALEKMELYQGRFWEEILFPGRRIPEPSLLRTHPPTERRIERLLALQAPASAEQAGEVARIPISLGHVKAPPRWHWPGLWY